MRVCTVCEKQYDESVTLCPDDGAPTVDQSNHRPAAEVVDPLIGRMVGSYKIYKMLGKGGMGAVYAGEHPAIGRKVAIKFLHEQYAKDKQIVARFFNEAKAVNIINHDNIVGVSDYSYLDEKMPYFVMEMLGKGYELGKLPRPVGLDVAGPIMLQVCDALAAAHGNNIIHRDLKPDNIFLSEHRGRKHFVKLMDFGIAKLSGDASQGQTQTGMVMGTPHYMSPEQASGKTSAIDGRSDIYSLGIIMYQLATGEVPFKGDSFAETLVAHIAQPPEPPRARNPSIPERYEQIILKSIAKKPEDRFQNTRELANDIAECMKELGCSFELPLADGIDPSAANTSGGGATIAVTGIGTRPPGQATRIGGSPLSGGTVALTADQAAQMRGGLSTGARAGLWVACIALGFGGVVGLRKAGVFGGDGDRLAAQVTKAREELAGLETQKKAAQAALADAQGTVAPVSDKVRVTLQSEPSGAEVKVAGNDAPLGRTPFTLELTRGATVAFLFALEGRAPHTETVVADGDKTVQATFAVPTAATGQ